MAALEQRDGVMQGCLLVQSGYLITVPMEMLIMMIMILTVRGFPIRMVYLKHDI